jgi:hypothetical protein
LHGLVRIKAEGNRLDRRKTVQSRLRLPLPAQIARNRICAGLGFFDAPGALCYLDKGQLNVTIPQ